LFHSSGSNAGGVVAKDKLGNDIRVEDWLKTHGPNDRTLAQGLKVSRLHHVHMVYQLIMIFPKSDC
jgi:hypothetical protein